MYMKKIKWFFGFLFVLTALLWSCNEDILYPDGSLDVPTLKSTTAVLLSDGTTLDACGTKILNLTGGQTYVVGTVEVSNDETNLYVTYKYLPTVQGAWFGNLHLWVGTDLATLPRSGGGAPTNGQFPYTFDGETPHIEGSANYGAYTFTIPLVEIPNFSKCGDKLYIVAHAETNCDINGDGDYDDEGETETAYAGSITGTGTDRWLFYDEFTIGCCGAPVVTGNLETAFAKPAIQEGGFVFVSPTLNKTGFDTYKNNPERYPYLNLTQNRWGWAANLAIAEDIIPPALTFDMVTHYRRSIKDVYETYPAILNVTNDNENLYITVNYNVYGIRVQTCDINTANPAPAYWQHPTYNVVTSPLQWLNPTTLTIPLNSLPAFEGFGDSFWLTVAATDGRYYNAYNVNSGWINYTPVQPISGTAEFPIYAGAGLNNTANGTLVGKALVSYNGTTLKLTYDLDESYEMEEVHIYADDAIPTKVAPGQFGFNTYFDPMVNDFETEFDVPDTNGDGKIWFILHAVVKI